MRRIPVKEIKLSEAMLTNVFSSLCYAISAFDKDIIFKINFPFFGKIAFKYLSYNNNFLFKLFYDLGNGEKINIIKSNNINVSTVKEIARHYMSGQNHLMIKDASNILK